MPDVILHSYPFYFDDWFNSETRLSMTAEQRGVYRDLLDFCWKEGSIPTDENVLRRMASVDGRTWARAWPRVSKCFFKEGDRYFNGKVNVKRPSVAQSKSSREKAASTAAKSRWANKTDVRDASTTQSERNAVLCGTPSPSPSPSLLEEPLPLAADAAAVVNGNGHRKPKKEPTATELKIREIAARMSASHPIRGCVADVAAEQLRKISKMLPPIDVLFELDAIEARHGRWLTSDEWTHDGGQWMKGLKAWLNPKEQLWRLEPSALFKRDDPNHNPYEIEYPELRSR